MSYFENISGRKLNFIDFLKYFECILDHGTHDLTYDLPACLIKGTIYDNLKDELYASFTRRDYKVLEGDWKKWINVSLENNFETVFSQHVSESQRKNNFESEKQVQDLVLKNYTFFKLGKYFIYLCRLE